MKNMFLWALGIAAFIALAWFFVVGKNISKTISGNSVEEISETTLYLNWIYSGSFTGEVVGASNFSASNGLSINLIEGGAGADPLKLVRNNQFGIASSDEILRANEKGQDFVIIGVVNDDHPAAFVSLKPSGIVQPSDFVGKRVGVLPFGSTGLIYNSLLKTTGVKNTEITEVVVSPDIRPFLSGALNDVQPIFIFDETITLEDLDVEYNLIVPKDYGVHFKGASYFTTRKTIEESPELVQQFINAMIEGWDYTAHNPDQAIQILKAKSRTIDIGREKKLLGKALLYYVDGTRPLLDTDIASWDSWGGQLVDLGVLRTHPVTSTYIDMRFVRTYHTKKQ